MTAGILSSIPRGNLVFVPRRINGQLRSGERVIATGAVTQFTLPSPVGSRPIEVLNNTGTEMEIAATLGATISGTNAITGTAFSGDSSVRVPASGRAVLTASGANWNAVGCTGSLVFSYNGTPLASNGQNPGNASDLFHWLFIQNGNANPAGTTFLSAIQSSNIEQGLGTASVLSDRAAPSSAFAQNAGTLDVEGSWFGWQIDGQYAFRPTGLLLLLHGLNTTQHPRNFEIRVNTGTGLNSASSVSSWSTAASFSNQTQIGTTPSTWHFFEWSSVVEGNQFAIRSSGLNSSGANSIYLQECCWFGVLS